MSTYQYREEAKAAKAEVDRLVKHMHDTTEPGTVGRQLLEIDVCNAEIVYHDRMYDLYDSLGNTAKANLARQLMEQSIETRNGTREWLKSIGALK